MFVMAFGIPVMAECGQLPVNEVPAAGKQHVGYIKTAVDLWDLLEQTTDGFPVLMYEMNESSADDE